MNTPSHWRNVEDFLIPGDCIADAIDAAIASYDTAPAGASWPGPELYLPAGDFVMRRALNLKRRVAIIGSGSAGLHRNPATTIRVDRNVTPAAIVINGDDTLGDQIEDPETTTAAGSLLVGFKIVRTGSSATSPGEVGHGIWLRTRATLRDLEVANFAENGIHIVASATSDNPARRGNANSWRLDTVQSNSNGGHGVFVDGPDVNAGTATYVNSTRNGGWGVYDSSFLGNAWLGAHTSANDLGSYKADNANARAVFIGCYAEGNQPDASVGGRSLMIQCLGGKEAGTQTIDAASGSAVSIEPGIQTTSPGLHLLMGSRSNQFLQMRADGDHPRGLSWYWNDTNGTYELRHARLSNRRAFAVTSNLTPDTYGRAEPVGGGHVVMPRGTFLGSGSRARHLTMDDCIPTALGGRGDICFNTQATGPLLWKCEGGTNWVAKDYDALEARVAALEADEGSAE